MQKILELLEEHVEKIVLAVVALICVWLLVTQVLVNPNAVEFGRDEWYNPGSIDDHINGLAKRLEDKLNRPPERLEDYSSRLTDYTDLLASSITGVDFSIVPPFPERGSQGEGGIRRYNLPEVGGITDFATGRIRAVAYVPSQEITAEHRYTSNSAQDVNDLDLVTVQGRFDVAGLYERFADSFAGSSVKLEWRDPCLAVPVFAAVHLQRRDADEASSEWVDVPRTAINHDRELFTIIENVADLPPGGMLVRMLAYKDPDRQQNLLQPHAYQIATAEEDWFPPRLHAEYVVVRDGELREQKRKEREEEEEKKRQETQKNRSGGGYGASGTYGAAGGYGRTGQRTATSTRSRNIGRYGQDSTTERERPPKATVSDMYEKLDAILISPATHLRTLESLLFWAYDDTVEPGRKYRYRIRLGVFNPVAGKNQLSKQYASSRNEVILWTDFAKDEETKVVEIPRRIYFFANGIQKAAKEVSVQISKFVLGRWYTEDFKVKTGEVIGDVRQTTAARRITASSTPTAPFAAVAYSAVELTQESTAPKSIDYDTGAVLVDVVEINDWAGTRNMTARRYFDVLYSYDGAKIEHMPVGSKYWAADLRIARSEISSAQRRKPGPWSAFGSKSLQTGYSSVRYRGYSDEDDE